MTMRELTRCIRLGRRPWRHRLCRGRGDQHGLAQSEGVKAWLVFAAYAPFYGLVHVFHADMAGWQDDSAFLAAALVAQFLYFLAIVVLVRFLYRNRNRARR